MDQSGCTGNGNSMSSSGCTVRPILCAGRDQGPRQGGCRGALFFFSERARADRRASSCYYNILISEKHFSVRLSIGTASRSNLVRTHGNSNGGATVAKKEAGRPRSSARRSTRPSSRRRPRTRRRRSWWRRRRTSSTSRAARCRGIVPD